MNFEKKKDAYDILGVGVLGKLKNDIKNGYFELDEKDFSPESLIDKDMLMNEWRDAWNCPLSKALKRCGAVWVKTSIWDVRYAMPGGKYTTFDYFTFNIKGDWENIKTTAEEVRENGKGKIKIA